MNPIRFSILVPSVPSRLTGLAFLVAKLQALIELRVRPDLEVELLVFTDNKRRSIGAKRTDLVTLARGEYLAFVDDDDDVSDDYVDKILEATEGRPDVVVFDQEVRINDDPPRTVRFGLEFENQEIGEPGTVATRKPFHCCAWRSSIAKRGQFSDKQWGEDWDWVQQVLPLAKAQQRVEAVLHTYRWSAIHTEAH